MKTFLLFICLFLSGLITAQPVEYKYDQNGNRIQRKLVVCNNCPQTSRQVSPEEDKKQQEVAKELGLSVFPNPAQDKVSVVINNLPEGKEAAVLLIDAQGKNLLDNKTNAQQNEMDMTPYKPGVYFIKVVVGKETLFYKVLKL